MPTDGSGNGLPDSQREQVRQRRWRNVLVTSNVSRIEPTFFQKKNRWDTSLNRCDQRMNC